MALQYPKAQALSDLGKFYDADLPGVRAATYTTTGAAPVSLIIIRESADPSIMPNAPPGDEMIIRAKTADVSKPIKGDVFIIDSETWYLRGNIGVTGGVVRLKLTRSDRRGR